MDRLMMRKSKAKEALPLTLGEGVSPSDNLAVTFSKDGSPRSVFSDESWDYSATTQSQRVLNFRLKIQNADRLNDIGNDRLDALNMGVKFLKTITLHWVCAVGGCSTSKLNGDVASMSFLVRHCLDAGVPVERIFSEPDGIDFLVRKVATDKQIGLFLGKVQRIAETANSLSSDPFWGQVKPSHSFYNRLTQTRKKFPETSASAQTMVIPSEIYQNFLKQTIEDLARFLENKSAIETLFRARALCRDQAVKSDLERDSSSISANQRGRLNYVWQKKVEEEEVSNSLRILAKADISKNETWGGLSETLRKWQMRCAILIAAFSGMRRSEIQAIPVNGLKYISTSYGNVPVVWSTTTKLEKGGVPRFSKWVTGSAVEAAFEVAKIICDGVLEWSTDRDLRGRDEQQQVPLFISIEHAIKSVPHPYFKFTTNTFSIQELDSNPYVNALTISELDYDEISWFLYGENIPPNIKVGGLWPINLHQFRRSMAVYAAASGRVSYPVLKSQLKHMSMVMTVYYSDHNSRAKNLFGDSAEVKALNAEWQDAKARVEADDLHALLESGQTLAGSGGKKLQFKKSKGALPEFFENRRTTKQAAKQGKIRYRPTMVGGCMSLPPCNKGAGVLASACVSCENAVFLPGSRVALEQTKEFYMEALVAGAPKLARMEYENNIKKIDVFLHNLTETVETAK